MLSLRLRLLLVAALALTAGIGIGTHFGDRRGLRASASIAPAEPLAGLPQHGPELGDPAAPVTLVEYADLQCPYCAYWSRTTFPVLVRDYVRPGKVKLVFRGLAFIGPDSRVALQAALAAGAQDRLWNLVERLYLHQGPENSGWVTNERLRLLASTVAGLDVDRVLDGRTSGQVAAEMLEAARAADAASIHGTPSFELGPTGGRLRPLAAATLNPESFRPALDALLDR